LKKLYSVQYLRFVAALLVLHCHAINLARVVGVGSFQQDFFFLGKFGAIGVDIFFVISGFIILYISGGDAGPAAATQFMKRRLIRIVPSYHIASIIMLAFLLLGKSSDVFPWREIVKTVTLLPLADYGPVLWTPLISIGWTLGFEFLFYVLYATLVALSIARKDLWLIVTVIGLYLLGQAFPLANLQWLFATNPMILEFAFGVMIAIVYKSSVRVPYGLSLLLFAAGLIAFLALVLLGFGSISESGLIMEGLHVNERILLWGLPSALLVAGLILMERSRPETIRKNRLLVFLGDASYSMYLAHPLCYYVIAAALVRMPSVHIQGDVLIAGSIIAATISGALFHVYIERPVIRRLSGRRTAPSISNS
jgi:exopolysaccharide production protein ExoZ